MTLDVYPTEHAVKAMRARRIQWAAVLRIIDSPDVVYGPDYKGYKTYQRDKYAVVVSNKNAVITVLMREFHQWTDADAEKNFKSDVMEALNDCQTAFLARKKAPTLAQEIDFVCERLGATYKEVLQALTELRKAGLWTTAFSLATILGENVN